MWSFCSVCHEDLSFLWSRTRWWCWHHPTVAVTEFLSHLQLCQLRQAPLGEFVIIPHSIFPLYSWHWNECASLQPPPLFPSGTISRHPSSPTQVTLDDSSDMTLPKALSLTVSSSSLIPGSRSSALLSSIWRQRGEGGKLSLSDWSEETTPSVPTYSWVMYG